MVPTATESEQQAQQEARGEINAGNPSSRPAAAIAWASRVSSRPQQVQAGNGGSLLSDLDLKQAHANSGSSASDIPDALAATHVDFRE
jgi:hypothetical protein